MIDLDDGDSLHSLPERMKQRAQVPANGASSPAVRSGRRGGCESELGPACGDAL